MASIATTCMLKNARRLRYSLFPSRSKVSCGCNGKLCPFEVNPQKRTHCALSHTWYHIYIYVCVSILCMFQTNAFVSLYWLTYIDIIYVNVHLFLYICIYLSSCLFIFHIVYNVDIEFIILFSYCYVSLLVTYFSIYIPMHLPIYLATYLHVQLWTYLPIYLSICVFAYLPNLFTYPPMHLSSYLPVCLSAYPPI